MDRSHRSKGVNNKIVGTSKKVRVNAMLFCKLVTLLMEGPISFDELAETTGLHNRTVRYWIAEMKRQHLVFIAGWGPDSRGFIRIPLFQWGNKRDVKPAPLSSAERSARHRAKVKRLEDDRMIRTALVGATPCQA